jgi:hypothetical protein
MQLLDKCGQGISPNWVHQVRAQAFKCLLAVSMNQDGGSINAHLFQASNATILALKSCGIHLTFSVNVHESTDINVRRQPVKIT